MCHITTWEEDYKGNNTSPSFQSPLTNSSTPSCSCLALKLPERTRTTRRGRSCELQPAQRGNCQLDPTCNRTGSSVDVFSTRQWSSRPIKCGRNSWPDTQLLASQDGLHSMECRSERIFLSVILGTRECNLQANQEDGEEWDTEHGSDIRRLVSSGKNWGNVG
jgi:hypothetical protein